MHEDVARATEKFGIAYVQVSHVMDLIFWLRIQGGGCWNRIRATVKMY